jgi:hypothetical protein
MNLPTIVNIAIGLIFVYLTLSLLASGLQEWFNSFLELRAKNLKDSIRNLLGEENTNQASSETLTEALYRNPLIQGMNQKFHQLSWLRLGRKAISAGPSYIDADTFANGLLSELGLSELSREISEVKLDKFIDQQLYKILEILPDFKTIVTKEKPTDTEIKSLIQEFAEGTQKPTTASGSRFSELKNTLYRIRDEFEKGNAELESSVSRIQAALIQYFEDAKSSFSINNDSIQQALPEASQHFLSRLKNLERSFQAQFSNDEKLVLLNSLKPNLVESIRELTQIVQAYKEAPANAVMGQDDVSHALKRLGRDAKEFIDRIPAPLAKSLQALAEGAQRKAKGAEISINQFQAEVEAWFDASMARASGAFKRFNQVIAFLIGFAIAIFANADTFNMVSQLSKESDVREALVSPALQYYNQRSAAQASSTPAPIAPPVAGEPAASAPTVTSSQEASRQQAIQNTKEANAILEQLQNSNVSLPLGWSTTHVSQQLSCPAPVGGAQAASSAAGSSNEELGGVEVFFGGCPDEKQTAIDWGTRLRMIVGWLPTAIAVSMGAPFWFDLLGRLINVRSTGSKPKSSTGDS